MKLSELQCGQEAEIVSVNGTDTFGAKMMDMGFVAGHQVKRVLNAPLQDPVKYSLLGYEVSLRRNEAEHIEVRTLNRPGERTRRRAQGHGCHGCCADCAAAKAVPAAIPEGKGEVIKIALVGNPNSGKTSVFNIAAAAHERVGNYAGVTVESKTGVYHQRGYVFEITDLPGVYSLSSHTAEEAAAVKELNEGKYDVIVNVVDSTNPVRNLLLTTQLADRGCKMVVGLNMYDELRRTGGSLDHGMLSEMMGIRMQPIVARTGEGLTELFDAAIMAHRDEELPKRVITEESDRDDETTQRYAFIEGAVAQTFSEGDGRGWNQTRIIDAIVTNRLFGFPIFLAVMFAVFWATFTLGQYPMDWIETATVWLGEQASALLPEGWLQSMVVDGIIGGVGGVIVFLPNIMILYFCLSYLEDSGYMARAAFIMDRIMHKIGVHGKSFIPLVMGLGCNVPAIMATRSIASRSSRLITILINPFISCSARLPVIVLLVGTFFPLHSAMVFLGLYVAGIVVAVITAKVLRKWVYGPDTTPFVLELPPYRVPTFKSTMRHAWFKGEQYLRKMGGIILLASIGVWVLSYFPTSSQDNPQQDSYLESMGKFINPVMEPLGFNWQASVAAVAGVPAKEVVVSTLGVLYSGDEEAEGEVLSEQLKEVSPATGKPGFTAASALSFLLFVLLYCPCIATVTAVAREGGSWKYGAFSVVYNTVIAWLVALLAYQLMSL